MRHSDEDISHNFGTILFIILFSLFALAFSNNSKSLDSTSLIYQSQNELILCNAPNHSEAILFITTPLPDIQKICASTIRDNGLNSFSVPYILSDYDRKTTRKFIIIQKTGLSIEPVFLWKLYCHFPLSEDDDLPVLS